MTWHPPDLPEHQSTKVYRQRDDANKPHAHKSNRRDVVEIELMRRHFDSDMSEREWMQLCNKHCGYIYDNGHLPKEGKSESK